MTVGSYTGAVRYPFNEPGTPGLSFSGNGRGNNALTGSFQVLETTVADDGSLLSFAADFAQYDEGWQNGWNKGAIRFNSDLPIVLTPEPINEAELIALGYLPDPDLQIPEEPIAEEAPPSIEPEPIVTELPSESSPILVEEPKDEVGEIIPDITLIDDPLQIQDNEYPEVIMYFSSGSSSTMVLAEQLTPTSIFLPAQSPQAAPGPLPVAAALAGWHGSRRLRRRCKAHPMGNETRRA